MHLIQRTQAVVLIVLASMTAAGCGAQVPREPLENRPVEAPESAAHWQREMAGEVTQDSVILQARMTMDGQIRHGEVEGRPGVGAFVLSTDSDFKQTFRTRWMAASPEDDYVLKTKVAGLQPNTRYYYRLLSGPDADSVEAGPAGAFQTLGREGVSREVSLVVVTGMNRYAFQATVLRDWSFRDRRLGFPALATIVSHEPDFFIATGDTPISLRDNGWLGIGKNPSAHGPGISGETNWQ